MAEYVVQLTQRSSGATPVSPAAGLRSEAITAPLLPDLAYAAGAGMLVSGSQAAAGVAPGTSATTTTPGFTVWWSSSSIVGVYIVDYTATYVSGTIGAGHIMYGTVAATTAPSGGTAITVYSAKDETADSRITMGTGHTTTAMSATTDRIPVMNLYATLATAPAAGVGAGIELVSRCPVNRWLPAGTAGCFYGVSAAGSSPLIRASVRVLVYGTAMPV